MTLDSASAFLDIFSGLCYILWYLGEYRTRALRDSAIPSSFPENLPTEERVNMENEPAKEKKQVLRNFVWATMFLLILCFAAMGILFYMLIPNLQISPISPGTQKLLLLVASIFLLAAVFTWVFWYRLALKKYKEELEIFEKSKISRFLSGRAFKVLLFLMILLALGIGWYFGDRIFG